MNDTEPAVRSIELTIAEGTDPCRLDGYLGGVVTLPARSQLKQRIANLRCNGKSVKLSTRVEEGDHISFDLAPERSLDITPEEIPLDIVYEDGSVVVVNKPAGMVVHPGAGNWSGTLLHALAGRYPQDAFFSVTADTGERHREDPVRPGIVHRLDKDTSGVMIVAKNVETHQFLVSQFSSRTTQKRYIALVKGSPHNTCGSIDGTIARDRRHRTRFTVVGALHHESVVDPEESIEQWDEQRNEPHSGKVALTTYRVLRRFNGYTLMLLKPHTGRTHQLRVHLAAIGCPILGDPLYARPDRRFPDPPMMLHALRLEIGLAPGEAIRVFKASVPKQFRETVQNARALPGRR